MSAGIIAGIQVACAMTLTVFAYASEPPSIEHNPFARPPSELIADSRSPNQGERVTPVSMELRATMVTARGSLANIAGKILSPGDEVQGYTLVRVFEDRAIFDFEGRPVTIYVRPEPGENDD